MFGIFRQHMITRRVPKKTTPINGCLGEVRHVPTKIIIFFINENQGI